MSAGHGPRYTLGEIDAMRAALARSYPDGVYFADERSREIEDRIRTYMAGGVDPKEVIEACSKRIADMQRNQL